MADGDGRQSAGHRDRAQASGVEIGFGSWLLAASVPTLVAMVVLPLLLYQLIGPEVTATPEAPAAARQALAALGPLTPQRVDRRWSTFVVMVALWALAATLGLDSTAIAFLGLGVLLATGVLTLGDIAQGRRRARRPSSGSRCCSRSAVS